MSARTINTAIVAACCGVVGQSLVKTLVEDNIKVVGLCRLKDRGRVKFIEDKYQGQFRAFSGSMSDPESCTELLNQSLDALGGRVEAYFHAAGVYSLQTWQSVTPEEVERLWQSNFTTAWMMGRAVFRSMQESGGGSMMYVSAGDTIRSAPAGSGPYLASKAALNMLVQSMAAEGAEADIKVNAMLPGIVDTEVNRKAMPDQDPQSWVNPDQLAGIMVELSQPHLSNVTGALIPVNSKSM